MMAGRLSATAFLVCLVLAIDAQADVYYVWTNAPSPNPPYANWETAAHTIQDAINETRDGDTVLVTNGVYNTGEAIPVGALLANRIVVTNGITVKTVNGPDVTFIVGQGPLGSSAVRCAYLTNYAVLSGFTLTNGYTRTSGDSVDIHGGGIYAKGAHLTNCVLVDNYAYNRGGGAYEGTLMKCMLTANSAVRGGGAYGGMLNGCILTENFATDAGGGVAESMLNDCVLTQNQSAWDAGGAADSALNNCVLTGNTAVFHGGGVYECTMNNCVLTGNVAGENGGGAADSNTNVMSNCTLVGNYAKHGGGAWGCILVNCIVYSNISPNEDNLYGAGTTCSYSCTTPAPEGVGNITNEPLFVASNDYRLAMGSPCIDAGTNLVHIRSDLEGIPRPLDGDNNGTALWDMGCYEYIHLEADTDGDRFCDGGEIAASTDPLDPDSFLGLIGLDWDGTNSLLTWKTVFGKGYWLQRTHDLSSGWTNVNASAKYELGELPEGTESVLDLGALTDGPIFYRVLLE